MPTLRTLFNLSCFVAAAATAAPCLGARAEDPLKRFTPVPASEPVPAIDFFRPPLFTDPKLNREGTLFAAFVTVGRERQAMLLCDIASGKLNVLDAEADRDIYDFAWLDARRIMSRLSTEKRFASGIYVIDISSIDRVETYPIEFHSATRTVGIPRGDPLRPIIWIKASAYDEGRDGGILQIDAKRRLVLSRDEIPGTRGTTSHAEEMRYGVRASVVRAFPSPKGGTPTGYLSDLDGHLAFGFTQQDGLVALHRFVDGAWVKAPVDLERTDIVEIGDKPGELIVLEQSAAGRPRGLQRMDAATGELGEVLFRDEQYDCDRAWILRQPVTNRIIGVGVDRARWENTWFDDRYARIEASVQKQFPKESVAIVGANDRETRFFVAAWSDRKPRAYYLADLEKGTFGLIKSSRPWIDPDRMRPMNIVRYKTRDGKEIEGYLTLPAGAGKASPAPLIIYPHGGPWTRDSWTWDPVAQFFASRGFAVLQPNYRGSDSYVWRFGTDDVWAFRRMHEDVTDSIAAVKKTGLIDPDRIAIMGGSFGGYLAVCGAAFEPEQYRCAVTIAGVFDWERMIREVRWLDENSVRAKRLVRKLGNPAEKKAYFDEISPLRHIESVRIPIFVAHGTDDQVVDVAQSKRLVAELARLNKRHVVHFERGEGHGMAFVANEVELYTKIEKFLAEHLAPRGAPGPSATDS